VRLYVPRCVDNDSCTCFEIFIVFLCLAWRPTTQTCETRIIREVDKIEHVSPASAKCERAMLQS